MTIRRAEEQDKQGILGLLAQVNNLHASGRPDLFKAGERKYTEPQLNDIIRNDEKPIFVAADDNNLYGYCFCVKEQYDGNDNMVKRTTLYIDDLCVDESHRGEHVGRSLYDHVVKYAREAGCYNVTLNVWECNPSARRFYEKMGLKPYKTGMEVIL